MNTKYTSILGICSLFLLSMGFMACGITVNDKKAYDSYADKSDFHGFTKINAEGGTNIYIKQDSTFSVKVEGSEEDQSHLELSQQGDELTIEENWEVFESFDKKKGCDIYISMPLLHQLELSAATNVVFEGPFSQSVPLVLSSSGAAALEMHLSAPYLEITSSGASTMALTGKVGHLKLDLSGASKCTADGLEADSVDVELSGAGNTSVWAKTLLTADLSGAGTLRYKGNPNVEKDLSGGAFIEKMD